MCCSHENYFLLMMVLKTGLSIHSVFPPIKKSLIPRESILSCGINDCVQFFCSGKHLLNFILRHVPLCLRRLAQHDVVLEDDVGIFYFLLIHQLGEQAHRYGADVVHRLADGAK